MKEKSRSPHAYLPSSLQDLLSLKNEEPTALLYAGGTYILRDQRKHINLPGTVLSMEKIEELYRIHRTERYLEIGAMVPINTILEMGKYVLPPALGACLRSITPPAVRNLATLVGNLCVPQNRMDSFPLLHIMDSRVEIRSSQHSTWIPMTRFYNPQGGITLEANEVVTRIRIPDEQWNKQVYRKIGSTNAPSANSVSLCGLATVQKSVVADIRFAFGMLGPVIIRSRKLEAEILGRRLPLGERDRETLEEMITQTCNQYREIITPFQRSRIRRLFLWFLTSISVDT